MLKSFKVAGWKRWQRANKKEGETVKYAAFQNANKDRIILFESAHEMIYNFKKNHVFYGGKGWDRQEHMQGDLDEVNNWKFGSDYPTLRETNRALERGDMKEKYIAMRDEITQSLFDQFPELYELSAAAVDKRTRKEFSEEGDEMDMDRFMDGDDKMWMKKKKRDTKVPAARVYVDICVTAGTSTEVITKNLIYSLVICEILTKSGLPLEIIVGATSKGATNDAELYNVSIVAKKHDEPLDISRVLTFALPGVFREYVFGTFENITDGRADYGLGTVQGEKGLKPILDFMDADISIQGGNAVLNPAQLKVIIDKVAYMLNMQLNGTGYAYRDGEEDTTYERRAKKREEEEFSASTDVNNGEDDWINDHIVKALNSPKEEDEWNPKDDDWGEGWD